MRLVAGLIALGLYGSACYLLQDISLLEVAGIAILICGIIMSYASNMDI